MIIYINEVAIEEPVTQDLDLMLTESYNNRPEIKQAEVDKIIFDKQIKYASHPFP